MFCFCCFDSSQYDLSFKNIKSIITCQPICQQYANKTICRIFLRLTVFIFICLFIAISLLSLIYVKLVRLFSINVYHNSMSVQCWGLHILTRECVNIVTQYSNIIKSSYGISIVCHQIYKIVNIEFLIKTIVLMTYVYVNNNFRDIYFPFNDFEFNKNIYVGTYVHLSYYYYIAISK